MSRSAAAPNLSEGIAGVVEHRLEPHHDSRGSFTEVFRRSWGLPVDAVQWSLVRSHARTLRGLYVHLEHDEYFHLVSGRALVFLKDLRPDSATFGAVSQHGFDDAGSVCLAFPRGVLHGWYFPEDAVHLQATSEEHAVYHPADNLGCHWADLALGVTWPDSEPRVSLRSAALPPLADLLATLEQRRRVAPAAR